MSQTALTENYYKLMLCVYIIIMVSLLIIIIVLNFWLALSMLPMLELRPTGDGSMAVVTPSILVA